MRTLRLFFLRFCAFQYIFSYNSFVVVYNILAHGRYPDNVTLFHLIYQFEDHPRPSTGVQKVIFTKSMIFYDVFTAS